MDNDKKVTLERWLIKADHDIEAARRVLEREPILTDMGCFHAQQAAEKSLKAFLTFKGRKFEKTHDLVKPANLCGLEDDEFMQFKSLLANMTSYAVVDRYSDDWREILLDEAQEAVGKAEKCITFVKTKVGL